jgi:uncharacterized protein
MTVGAYGLVAAIVKLDDAGLYLLQRKTHTARAMGHSLLWFAAKLMRTLDLYRRTCRRGGWCGVCSRLDYF